MENKRKLFTPYVNTPETTRIIGEINTFLSAFAAVMDPAKARQGKESFWNFYMRPREPAVDQALIINLFKFKYTLL